MMYMAIKKYEADLLEEHAKYFTAAREAPDESRRLSQDQTKLRSSFNRASEDLLEAI